MATKTKKRTTQKKGFGATPERRLGTGWSRAYAHSFFALTRKNTGVNDIEAIREMCRDSEQQEASKILPKTTLSEVFMPPYRLWSENPEVDQRSLSGGEVSFSCGFWSVAFSFVGADRKRPCWTLNAWAGSGWLHHADQIEFALVRDIGRDNYNVWRHQLFADWESLVAVLKEACRWLEDHGMPYAWSWTSSDRSEALLRKLGIRCERGFAFLMGHYERDLFDLTDKTPVLDMGEAMLSAGATAQEILRAIATDQHAKKPVR